MPSTIWKKYAIIKEIKSNSNCNIRTYLTRIEPIVKEITPKDKNDYELIISRLNKFKKENKIYDIIEENEKIYVVIDNNEEMIAKIDKAILSEGLIIENEAIIVGHGYPMKKMKFSNYLRWKNQCVK